MHILLYIFLILLVVVAAYYFYRLFILKEIEKLPLIALGFPNVPAVPVVLAQLPGTLLKLLSRTFETRPAMLGLTEVLTLGDTTATAHSFLFDGDPIETRAKALRNLRQEVKSQRVLLSASLPKVQTRLNRGHTTLPQLEANSMATLPLTDPKQFSLTWTTFTDVNKQGAVFLDQWSKSIRVDEKEAATAQFWPTIAQYGLAYNLLVLQKLEGSRAAHLRQEMGSAWSPTIDGYVESGNYYFIDMTIFESFEVQQVHGLPRFVPSTITFLKMDKEKGQLRPIRVVVSGYGGKDRQIYAIDEETKPENAVWIYALLAAKTSITTWGIWLGHVYHWHIVTAALQMTFFNHVKEDHLLQALLKPQFDYLMPFNNVLLLEWKEIAPPTPIATAAQFLELCNLFGAGRTFYEDDPENTLQKFGIKEEDFSIKEPWDLFPIVGQQLEVWKHTQAYVNTFVEQSYTDLAVSQDRELQAWIAASGDKHRGNVQGIGDIGDKAQLKQFLTSVLFRITMHGCSRLNNTANPGLTFVPNYPPCLQRGDIIPADTQRSISQEELLTYLPHTGTMGEMMKFYFTFVFSSPYESFIPIEGLDSKRFFPDTEDGNKINQALFTFRRQIQSFIEAHEVSPQISQWPLNIET